jgi:hypothetical protein
MADTPTPTPPEPTPPPPAAEVHVHKHAIHEVRFTAYPKLLFVWPLIVVGYLFWPLSGWIAPNEVHGASAFVAQTPAAAPADAAAGTAAPNAAAPGKAAPAQVLTPGGQRLETLAWIYLWVLVIVLLTLGVDIDRNRAAFFALLVGLIYLLGVYLRDVRGFTLFGDIYRWFASLDLQYNRSLGLAGSVLLSIPFALMLAWARLNDRWRITHNEFEHFSFGKANDSLGRGAKTIRTDYPDVFELLLGLAGTLIVFNASGTRELRRIPNLMFLPLVRARLDTILERTAVTGGQLTEEEEDEEVNA